MRFFSILQLSFLLCSVGTTPAHAQRAQPRALVFHAAEAPDSSWRTSGIPDSGQVKIGKTRKVLLGMAIGAAVGGGSAYYFAKRSCAQVCDDPAPVLVPTVLFSFLGGLAGGLVVHVSSRPGNAPEKANRNALHLHAPIRRAREL